MLVRLEKHGVQLRRFTADAAHELRHAAHGAQGGIEVALRTERSGEEYRAVLASSLEEVERVSRLAEDLLLPPGSRPASEERTRVDLEPLVSRYSTWAAGSPGRPASAAAGGGEPATYRLPCLRARCGRCATESFRLENRRRSEPGTTRSGVHTVQTSTA